MFRFLLTLSRLMAILGGIMLSALVILTCVSIIGRWANSFLHDEFALTWFPDLANWLIEAGVASVRGDFEYIEAGIAFTIFAFLPLCQITGGHATVDVFTARMSPGTNRVLRLFADVAFAAVMVLIAVQLYGGMVSKIESGQTTLQLQFPVWWSYALSLMGAALAAIVAVFIGFMRFVELFRREEILPADLGAEH